jgi:hypothetical protein
VGVTDTRMVCPAVGSVSADVSVGLMAQSAVSIQPSVLEKLRLRSLFLQVVLDLSLIEQYMKPLGRRSIEQMKEDL